MLRCGQREPDDNVLPRELSTQAAGAGGVRRGVGRPIRRPTPLRLHPLTFARAFLSNAESFDVHARLVPLRSPVRRRELRRPDPSSRRRPFVAPRIPSFTPMCRFVEPLRRGRGGEEQRSYRGSEPANRAGAARLVPSRRARERASRSARETARENSRAATTGASTSTPLTRSLDRRTVSRPFRSTRRAGRERRACERRHAREAKG
jgi:hypothetical protein